MTDWRAVADALFLAHTDRERKIADERYRRALREVVFGPNPDGVREYVAAGPVGEDQMVYHVAPREPGPYWGKHPPDPLIEPYPPHPDELERVRQWAATGDVPPGVPGQTADLEPTEGDIRSHPDGGGRVEQFRQGLWQDVDPVDLFRHQAKVAGYERGQVGTPPERPPVQAVPDEETVSRREQLLAQRGVNRDTQVGGTSPPDTPHTTPDGS